MDIISIAIANKAKKLSEKGLKKGRDVHVYNFQENVLNNVYVNNDWCFVRTPDSYDPHGEPHPFVICNHGNGWVMDGTEAMANWTDKTQYGVNDLDDTDPYYYEYSNEVIERLLERGFVVCGAQNYASDGNAGYGSDRYVNSCINFYFHMIKNYNVTEYCHMIGASNGSPITIGASRKLGMKRVRSIILQYPLLGIVYQWNNNSTHKSGIEDVYNLTSPT